MNARPKISKISQLWAQEQTNSYEMRKFIVGDTSKFSHLQQHVIQTAKDLDLTGWYRHRSDGTMEVRVEGHRAREFSNSLEAKFPLHTIIVNEIPVDHGKFNEPILECKKPVYMVDDKYLRSRYRSLGIKTTAWSSFVAMHESGLLSKPNYSSVAQAKDFWKRTRGTDIDPSLHIAFESHTGQPETRIVPQHEFSSIRRHLNGDGDLLRAFSDKTLYPQLIQTERQPRTHLSRISSEYCDTHFNAIRPKNASKFLASQTQEAIIKPSRTDSSERLALLRVDAVGRITIAGIPRTWSWLEKKYGDNFIIQERLKQHAALAAPHSDSINTLRLLTLRIGGEIKYLIGFVRFGTSGKLNDNAGAGGISVGIDTSGAFNSRGIGQDLTVYTDHPTTGVSFESLDPIPNFGSIVEFALALHGKLPYFGLVSWSIAVDPEGDPIFIECNFRGAVWIYQLAAEQPLFGEYTERVLRNVRDAKHV
jgi:acylphosphatase